VGQKSWVLKTSMKAMQLELEKLRDGCVDSAVMSPVYFLYRKFLFYYVYLIIKSKKMPQRRPVLSELLTQNRKTMETEQRFGSRNGHRTFINVMCIIKMHLTLTQSEIRIL